MTVLEILIVATLVILLGGIIALVVRPVLDSTSRDSTRARLQQDGLVALNRMETDLRQSATAGISILSAVNAGDPVALAVNALKPGVFQGSQQWEDHLYVYVWTAASARLTRRLWPPGPPGGQAPTVIAPLQCPSTLLSAIALTESPAALLLASHVTSFSVEAVGDGAYRIHLLLEESLDQDRTERFDITRSVYARNHL